VKITRPGVGPGALPSTGTPFPVALLLLLGVGMVGGGLFMTVAGEPHRAGGAHRR
jgi:hypothetical protein